MSTTALVGLLVNAAGWILVAGIAWQKIGGLEAFRKDAKKRLRELELWRERQEGREEGPPWREDR